MLSPPPKMWSLWVTAMYMELWVNLCVTCGQVVFSCPHVMHRFIHNEMAVIHKSTFKRILYSIGLHLDNFIDDTPKTCYNWSKD